MESHSFSYMFGIFSRYLILVSVPVILTIVFIKNRKESVRIGVVIVAILFILGFLWILKNLRETRVASEYAKKSMKETQERIRRLEKGPTSKEAETKISAQIADLDEKYTQVIDAATKNINEAPNAKSTAEDYYFRAKAYYYFGKFDEAIKDLTSAIKINPRFADAYFYRGITYYKIGNDDMAEKDWKKTCELDPESKIGKMARENLKTLGSER
ncbi:MAG: tetratricopeptide repeat protein [Candidatus Omnitrophica bacterium]|nr:tetratricopeptide repeat protein [Candidatus Omnitrophota bacterium]